MKRSFELQGHRGARGLFPENTLEGFAATLAMGIRSLELDVSVTADDVAVVTHDPILNPWPGRRVAQRSRPGDSQPHVRRAAALRCRTAAPGKPDRRPAPPPAAT
jgi:glycerophosphoryl diester phosphodiesterase